MKPRRMKPNPDQMPLITPDSNWTPPTELPDLHGVTEIALDTETVDHGINRGRGPGWPTRDGHIAGVGVAWRTGSEMQRIYVPVAHPDTQNFPKESVARWVSDITRDRRVVMFNAGYDIGWLASDMRVPVPPVIDDASCAAFLVDENRDDLSLDGVCQWQGVQGKDLKALREAAAAYGFESKRAVANIGRLPARYAAAYGAQDPVSTLEVMDALRPHLKKQELLDAYRTEMRLIPLTHAMRRRGIRIDIDRAVEFQGRLRLRMQVALNKLEGHLNNKRVGLDDVRSHLWLVRTFEEEGVPTGTRGDKATFERDWMRRSEHWLPRLCAEARQCADMAEKFVGTYLLDFATNGRIHASVNQWLYEEGGTRSHRLSYADPPLQQAPSRGESFDGWPLTAENAVEFRSCFLPEEGELWFSPDYSQQEYRHIVADAEAMGYERADVAAQKYRDVKKADFHTIVAELTGLDRYFAKQCNFAKVFGAGVDKFAQMMDKPREKAAEVMAAYDRELPFVKQLSSRCQVAADQRGYIRMFDGARAHFDQWEVYLKYEERGRAFEEGHRINACSREEALDRQQIDGHPWRGGRLKRAMTHKAMNRRIQGNAARQMKLAMATCWDENLVPLLQMHDELSFSLTDPEAGKRIEEIMRTVYTCTVPFLVDAEWGTTWGDAKHSFKVAEAGWRENRIGGAGGRGQARRNYSEKQKALVST